MAHIEHKTLDPTTLGFTMILFIEWSLVATVNKYSVFSKRKRVIEPLPAG